MQRKQELIAEISTQLKNENYTALNNISAFLMARQDERQKRQKQDQQTERQAERLRCLVWFTLERITDPERLHSVLCFSEAALKVQKGEVDA